MNTVNTICYKLKTPVYYNKGTIYEKTCDTFLLHYANDDASEELERLNAILASGEYPEGRAHGEKLDWANIEYFFAHRQERFY